MDLNKLHKYKFQAKEIKKLTKKRDDLKDAIDYIHNKNNVSVQSVFNISFNGSGGDCMHTVKIPHHLTTFDVGALLIKQLSYVSKQLYILEKEFENG